MNDIKEIIKRIDLPTLTEIVGPTIIRALEHDNRGKDSGAIAEILILKYGNQILAEKAVRKALVYSFTESEAESFYSSLNLSGDHFLELSKYFKSYNLTKSKKLVSFLKLSSDYHLKVPTDERSTFELIRAKYNEPLDSIGFPHPYQKRIKNQIVRYLTQKTEKYFFIQMPTGAGKTVTALESVVDLFRLPAHHERNKRFVVWLVDSNELAEQALQSFKRLWKQKGDRDLKVFRLFNNFLPDFPNETEGIVFAGFAKVWPMLSPDNSSHDKILSLIQNTELLIIDEAHHASAETYRPTINSFKATPYLKLMGLSATPGRANPSETPELINMFSNDRVVMKDKAGVEIEDPIAFLQKGKYLARLHTNTLNTDVTEIEIDDSRLMTALASNSQRNELIIDQIKIANDAGDLTLVFACSIDHVYALHILCQENGIKSDYIIGDVLQADRIDMLEDFKNKKFNILINLDILSTGIDIPNINRLILTRPIKSPILSSQILGRALRGPNNGGNEINTIINLKDNIREYPGASFLYNFFDEDWN